MEDLNELRKQGIHQEKCLLCQAITPQLPSTEELAFWMAIHEWNAINLTDHDCIVYCPNCRVEFLTYASLDVLPGLEIMN